MGQLFIMIRFTLGLFSMMTINLKEYIFEWELVSLGSTNVIIVIILDFISVYFMSLVCIVAGRVLIFRTSYMRSEIFFGRFIALVISFVAAMLTLILRPNIIILILGWDGLGVTSYLLVIFYQSTKSYSAGIITALTNRLGDVGLLIAIAVLISQGDWRFIYHSFSSYSIPSISIILIVLSACTKSAQIPFSAWLPAAMAAPTPVSALVHSSTLVTAGVYLLIRIRSLLTNSSISSLLIAMGALTILIAGLTAIIEIDIKKVIALSTLSQLGVIMIIIGLGSPILAYFHLLSHAFFKAILFICAGILIHNMKDFQDIRKIGLRYNFIPTVRAIIVTANLSLCGLPFLRGFYSKDIILEVMLLRGLNTTILTLVLGGTFLTVAYSSRMRFLIGLNKPKSEPCFSITDQDKYILGGILILILPSILGGILLNWRIFSFNRLIYLPLWLKRRVLISIILAAFFAKFTYLNRYRLRRSLICWVVRNMWFLPLTLRLSNSKNFLMFSKKFNLAVEARWIETVLYNNLLSYFRLSSLSKYIDNYSNVFILQVLDMVIIITLTIFII